MARRAGWEKLPRSPAHPMPPPRVDDDDDAHAGIGASGGGRRSSFFYCRLPEQLLRLSVLKLDGSSFDVEVAKAASVMELKMEIEHLFSKPAEDGGCSISWSHLWGHFCLCYNEHKLTDDKASLRTFGIKDGDQLHFIRHLSPNQNLNRRRSRNRGTHFEQHRKSLTRQHIVEVADNDKDIYKGHIGPCRYVDEQSYDHGEEHLIVVHAQSKSGHLFQRWYSRLRSHKTKSRSQATKTYSKRKKFCWAICR